MKYLIRYREQDRDGYLQFLYGMNIDNIFEYQVGTNNKLHACKHKLLICQYWKKNYLNKLLTEFPHLYPDDIRIVPDAK